MATQLGKPAINTPKGNGLRDLQQVVENIRQRLAAADTAIASVQALQAGGAASSATTITGLQKQLAAMQAELDALTAVVAALQMPDAPPDPRVEQLVGQFVELQRAVAGIDPIGQTAVHAAQLATLQRRVDQQAYGVLV